MNVTLALEASKELFASYFPVPAMLKVPLISVAPDAVRVCPSLMVKVLDASTVTDPRVFVEASTTKSWLTVTFWLDVGATSPPHVATELQFHEAYDFFAHEPHTTLISSILSPLPPQPFVILNARSPVSVPSVV